MRVLTLPAPESTMPPTERARALVFEDPRSQQLLHRVRQVACGEAAALISGETGTGKELLARHIHELGARRGRPFIAVRCGALSPSQAEGELFGHAPAAGARRRGLLEAAEGGTLYLDEIGDLPLGAQARLLRALQEREAARAGARKPAPTGARIIAATSVPIESVLAVGGLREDLLARLSGATVAVPPLRERPGDVLPLARYFLAEHARRLGFAPCVLASSAVERLLSYAWPGNIRELERVIHRAFLVCRAGLVTGDDLPLTSPPPRAAPLPGAPSTVDGLMATLESTIAALLESGSPSAYERVEEIVIRAAYRRCERNLAQTASRLGMSRDLVRARLLQSGEIAAPPATEPAAPVSRTGEARAAVKGLLESPS